MISRYDESAEVPVAPRSTNLFTQKRPGLYRVAWLAVPILPALVNGCATGTRAALVPNAATSTPVVKGAAPCDQRWRGAMWVEHGHRGGVRDSHEHSGGKYET